MEFIVNTYFLLWAFLHFPNSSVNRYFFWIHQLLLHTTVRVALKRQLPSWRRRSASTAPESGQSPLGCAHRHGGQRWRTRELSGEKEAVSALTPAGTWWGRVRGTQDRHSLLKRRFREKHLAWGGCLRLSHLSTDPKTVPHSAWNLGILSTFSLLITHLQIIQETLEV